ncbi:MFS transporter [Chryseolinea sp. T2]|uniref:MFS transporter n=1 Tax=Chryseolinea sp. T2 TaxID=3129255 RepID=UPI003077465C
MELSKQSPGHYRWVVCALIFFATTINYIDRQVIGLLKPTLEQEYNWTESDYGNIVMAFSAAYALGLLLFGRIVDKIGTKMGYTVSVLFWSIAAMLHAAVRSTVGFGAVRAFLGISEAGNFPTAIKATAEWFPKRERAFATGIFNSGTNIGAVIAPIVVPWMLGAFGWRSAFLWTGAIGFIWLIFWWIYYEVPERQKRLSKAEYDLIHSDNELQEPGVKKESVPWRKLLGIRQTYAFVFGKLLTDPIWWFFLFWLPSYFAEAYNIDLKKPNLHLVIVYTATTIGSVGGGFLSSYLIRKGWPVFRARKLSMLFFAIAVTPIMLAPNATNVWVAVGLISLAAGAHQAWSANIFTTVSDMFPKHAVSSVVGIGGMAGSIGGMLFPLLVGRLLDHYEALGNIVTGYNILFVICGFGYLIAWTIMHFLAPRMEQVKL